MSVRRVFKWSCDFCIGQEEKESYKLPDGWKLFKANLLKGRKTVQHACKWCVQLKPETLPDE